MKDNIRKFISIYFSDGNFGNRKKRDITVAFDSRSLLYKHCKKLSSTQIKEIIECDYYLDVCKKAREEDRSISNYVKYKLRKKFKV